MILCPIKRCFLIVSLLLVWAGAGVCQPAKGFNELGVMAFKAQRYEQALEHFEKALALAPDALSIRRNICGVHQAMANDLALAGKFPEAIDRVLKGAAIDPENPSPRAQAGTYCLRSGQLPEAVKHLEAALALDPDHPETRAMLGEAYYQQNQPTKAREQWAEALKGDADLPGLQEKFDKLARESAVEEDFDQYAEGHFRLSYGEALSEDMRETVFRVLEEAYTRVGKALGGIAPSDPVRVVLYQGEQFTEATGTPAHVGALYDGKIRAPITGRGGRYLDERVLRVRLTHEYVHVALMTHLGPKVPWWLNEGLAEVFSREMDQSRRRLLGRAYRGERVYTLSYLESRQLERLGRDELAIAYAQAHAFAEHLWRTGKTEKLAVFIAHLKAGAVPEAALETAYGLDYAALEAAVAKGFGSEN